jgi:oligopeptide/dipeptide ABC transporter ATP-binding protein
LLLPGGLGVTDEVFLTIERVSKRYPVGTSALRGRAPRALALDDVSLTVQRREVVGLVGESGSGKSTLGRIILRLVEPDSGRVVIEGTDVTALRGAELRTFRRRMQMVFQDPNGSLDPRMTIGAQVAEGMAVHRLAANRADREANIAMLLERVGLSPGVTRRYPHELSGGQRQRVAIARALAVRPSLLVADEPFSALDVSLQAQILNLLSDLQAAEQLTLLLVSHDLRVVRHLCSRVVVLYRGRVVEEAPTEAIALATTPAHPYTRALVAAVPRVDPGGAENAEPAPAMAGASITAVELALAPSPPGCAYRARCPIDPKPEACATQVPPLRLLRPGHLVACHAADQKDARS